MENKKPSFIIGNMMKGNQTRVNENLVLCSETTAWFCGRKHDDKEQNLIEKWAWCCDRNHDEKEQNSRKQTPGFVEGSESLVVW